MRAASALGCFLSVPSVRRGRAHGVAEQVPQPRRLQLTRGISPPQSKNRRETKKADESKSGLVGPESVDISASRSRRWGWQQRQAQFPALPDVTPHTTSLVRERPMAPSLPVVSWETVAWVAGGCSRHYAATLHDG